MVLSLFPNLTDYITLGTDTLWYLARTEAIAFGADSPGDLWYLQIPAFFRNCGFTLQTSWQLFLWSITAVTAVSSYLCLKFCWKNKKTALLLTVVFLFWPLRISLLYEQGNVSCWVASGLVTLLFGAVGLVLNGKRTALTSRVKDLGYKLLAVCTVAAGVFSFYRWNGLAFHMAPVYLYGYVQESEEVLSRTFGNGKIGDAAADAALLFGIAVLAAGGLRFLWTQLRAKGKAAGRRKP
jgi:hypothetical protein